jgi:hypothetical protein
MLRNAFMSWKRQTVATQPESSTTLPTGTNTSLRGFEMSVWTLYDTNAYRYDYQAYTALVIWEPVVQEWTALLYLNGEKVGRGLRGIYTADEAFIRAANLMWDDIMITESLYMELGV